MHLFISHATKDCAREALALAVALERLGHRCWIAPRDVKPGVPYPGQIVAAVDSAQGMVLMVSAAANDSADVLQEVQLAAQNKLTIAPVMMPGVQPGPNLRYYIGVRHQVAWSSADAIALALGVTFARPPAASSAPAAYDLSQLHPDVRRAAEAARDAEQRANLAAERARDAAAQAEDAARRARTGEAGYSVRTWNEGDRYEGGFSAGALNGFGVYLVGRAQFAGDRHVGQFSGGKPNGVGVYAYAQNPNNTTTNALRYEGEYVNDRYTGVGVMHWRDGQRYAGGWRDAARSGHGVFCYADGRRYEGEWASSQLNGYGVIWDAQGRVSKAGIFTNDRLTQSLTR